MGSLGMPEILVILVIALIIFGPRKLPELGKTLGQSLAHFRKASEDFKRQWEDEVESEKRRLDAPSPVEAPAARSESVQTPVADYGAGELEQSAAASSAEQETLQEPLTVARGDSAVKETKRDWM
jgi:TatA/E family protein of Tat protein translocase